MYIKTNYLKIFFIQDSACASVAIQLTQTVSVVFDPPIQQLGAQGKIILFISIKN